MLMRKHSITGNNLQITWENLELEIDVAGTDKICSSKKKTLRILRNISGYAVSGECLAIMGGSGAGKSTLLNILSDRFTIEKNMRFKGKVLMNGKEMKWD